MRHSPKVSNLSSPTTGDWLTRGTLLLAVGALTFALASCATMKLGYNNADTLAVIQLNSYCDLTQDQELTVKERVNSLLAWHRSTQLRDYASFIDQARAKLAGVVTTADVIEFNHQLNARMMATGDRAAPDIAHLALTLTNEQIDQAAKKIASDAAKARREQARLEKEPGAERVKKYGERAESWFGRLTDAQKDIVRKSMASRPSDATWWIDEKERRQREFIALLRKIRADRPTEETATRWVRAYFKQLLQAPDAERRTRMELYRRHSAELVAQLINAATPDQRAHLDKKLAVYSGDFRSLAGING